MSDENNGGGSDLDIFEGLGKRNSEKVPVAGSKDPTSASNLATVRASADQKRTLLGIPNPATYSNQPPPEPPSTRPSTNPEPPQSGSHRTKSDAPPGRGSLPSFTTPKSDPPQRGSGSHRVPSEPPPHPRPQIVKTRAGILDDEDDAADTSVFQKDKVAKAAAYAATMPMEATTPPTTQNQGSAYEAKPVSAPKPSSAPKPMPSSAPKAAPSDTASLSDAFGALGEPEAGSMVKPVSAPVSSPMRAVPPPPPGSVKPGLNTAPITAPIPPPPPPKGANAPGMATLQSAQHPMPAPPGSVPPPPVTMKHVQAPRPAPSVPPPPAIGSQSGSQTGPSMPPPVQASLYPQSLPPIARNDATYKFPNKEPASNNGFIVAVLVAIAAVAGALVFFFMPRTGNLVVNVADVKGAPVAGLAVTVDGTKKCDSAPCIVKDIQAGTHSVSVTAQGYDAVAARAITVESRKDSSTDFSLVASKTAASNGTGVKIAGPTGAKITVDGKDMGALPLELKDLEPGDHKLHFSGDRYAPLDKTVTVGKDEMVDMGSVPLKVTKGKATLTLGTPGAKVTLVNGSTRKEVPSFPMAIEFDPSEKWTLSATKDGFDPYTQAISFDDGQAEKTYDISLSPKGAVASRDNGSSSPSVSSKKIMSAANGDDDDAPVKTKKSASADTSASSADTALKLNSLPSSSVYVDGNPIGNTPIPHFTVKPGSHTIMFVNSEQSLKKTISVDVKAGETKAAFAKLRDE